MGTAAEEVGLFGERCAQEAEQLQLAASEVLSVLGDGAERVWNLSARHFQGAQEALDFWHGAEHIADGAKTARGQSDKPAKEQAKRGKQQLLADGYCGVVEWVGELTAAGMLGVMEPHWAGS